MFFFCSVGVQGIPYMKHQTNSDSLLLGIVVNKHWTNKHYPPAITIMLATSKNVLCPGHNYLITTGAYDPMLWLSAER